MWFCIHFSYFQIACESFAKAIELCNQLAQKAESDNELSSADALVRKDLFTTRAESTLRPMFQYCQYELKEAGEELVEEPASLLSSTPASQQNDVDSITFRGVQIPIDNKDLRVLLLKLSSLGSGTSSSSEEKAETAFLQSLSILDDAMGVVQSATQTLSAGGDTSGPAVRTKLEQLQLWKGYLQYQNTSKVMDHTSALLATVSDPAERVHVYDALLQHNKVLLDLAKPGSLLVDDLDDDDEFALQAQANHLRLRAFKAYYMSLYYLSRQQLAQSKALVNHSQKLRSRAEEEIAACEDDMPHREDFLNEIKALESKLHGVTCGIQAALALSAHRDLVQKSNRPLLHRLNENDAGSILADVPPQTIPIPCKPVFYDLAYDMAIDMTDAKEIVEAYIEENSPEDDEDQERTAGGDRGILSWLIGK